jgi:hypothetical protein
MADNTQQGLFQNGLLQSLATQQPDPIQQMAREFAQKNAYFRQVLGDDIIDQGMQQYGPQFFTLLEQQLSQNPNITAALQGNSGQFMPMQNGLGPMNNPAMLNARLGVESDNLRAGINNVVVRMPDGSLKQMPRAYDAGYNTNVLGGNLDVGGSVVPKDGQMPKTMYNLQARFNKKF